jgi:hypothetical protein
MGIVAGSITITDGIASMSEIVTAGAIMTVTSAI